MEKSYSGLSGAQGPYLPSKLKEDAQGQRYGGAVKHKINRVENIVVVGMGPPRLGLQPIKPLPKSAPGWDPYPFTVMRMNCSEIKVLSTVHVMSSPKETECHLKAGHLPAVKAGGMRITQHKSPKEPVGLTEDTTGLKVSGSPPKPSTISGAIPKGNADFPAEAVQVFHKDKPPVHHNVKTPINIQQPRK